MLPTHSSIVDIHPEQDLIGNSKLESIITVKQLKVDNCNAMHCIAMFALFIKVVFPKTTEKCGTQYEPYEQEILKISALTAALFML